MHSCIGLRWLGAAVSCNNNINNLYKQTNDSNNNKLMFTLQILGDHALN